MTLRGWKEITEHTKLSVKTIKELAKRRKNPFPVIFIARKPLTTKNLFSEWVEIENKAQKKGVNS